MIFIVPSSDIKRSLGPLKDIVVHTLPFGIAALAGILERDGIRAAIVNDSITPVTEELLREAVKSEIGRPIFGLTSLTLQAARAKELSGLIRRVFPDSAVIVGGIHATALPEEFLDAGIQYVFSGEADLVITELVTLLMQNKDVSHIPGLLWRDASGEIRRNPPAALIDLKELPPFPYHLFEADLEHYDLGAVMSSRGCPYRCIFCSQRTITGVKHRTRPVEQVLKEIYLLTGKYKISYITFFDDNFVVSKQWTAELCSGIIAGGYHKKAKFMCQMRGDAVSGEMLDLLKNTGFDTLSFGIETGSERMAKVIQKGETVEANASAVRQAKGHGFETAGTFIIGFPTETDEDRDMTVRLAMSLPLDVMRINIAIPYPGTPFYNMVKDSITISPGWQNFNVVSPLVTGPFHKLPFPHVPEGTTDEELRFLMLWNNLKFWLRPKGFKSFFVKKSTFVTRLPARWYLKPGIVYGLARVGFIVLSNLAWLAAVAVRRGLVRFGKSFLGQSL